MHYQLFNRKETVNHKNTMETGPMNEPHGYGENQENHQTKFSTEHSSSEKESKDVNDNDLAGNAAGNIPDETNLNESTGIAGSDISGEDSTEIKGKGFMGDFSEPQHDDEQYDERTDNNL
jgi:hypothetical protein